jgi:hypothetical protein
MPLKPRVAEPWNITHPIAELRDETLIANVDVSKPQLGLLDVGVQAQAISGCLLSLTSGSASEWPAVAADAYVRGGDLVATYSPASNWPYAPCIYWRVEARDAALAAISLLVSIQTDLLDTHPLVRVSSQLAADEVLQLSEGENDKMKAVAVKGRLTFRPASSASGLVWRLPGGKISYAEFAEPNDFRQLVVEHADGVCRSEWELFAEFLEKGVIRRAQLHAAFLPRENDISMAAELCRGLSSRPLPLTT